MAASDDVKPITFDTFEEYKNTCGVRKIQQEAEIIQKQAAENNTDMMTELRKQGYKDFKAFANKCPQFNVWCWPIELAELGSGTVLYFHFLALLCCIFLLFAFLLLPVMIMYASEPSANQCGWKLVDDWTKAYKQGQKYGPPPPCQDTIGSGWMVPGNLGPSSAANTWIPTIYFLSVVVFCAAIFVAYVLQALTNMKVDDGTVAPNDFAALVSGLPVTANDEKSITEFFKENALPGKKTEIVKVIIGWDAVEFREKTRELRGIVLEMQEFESTDPQMRALMERRNRIQHELNSCADAGASTLKSSGTVVVIFRHEEDMRTFVNRYNGFWGTWFYCECEDVSFLPLGNGLCKGGKLPKYPLNDKPIYKLDVSRAPNPGDINWEELGVEWSLRWKMMARTNSIMALLIVISFGIVYGCNKLQYELRTSDGTVGNVFRAMAALPALITAGSNMGLSIAAKTLGKQEYHETITGEQFSQALKMTVAMIINTAGVILFISAQPNEWYQVGGLVETAFILLVFNSILPPTIAFFDPPYLLTGILKRRKLTQEKIDGVNEVLTRGPPKTKEEAAQRREVNAEIQYFERAYRPSELNNARRYANGLKTFFCNLFFCPLLPSCAMIGLLGLLVQYVVDKYLVTRWYSRAERPSNSGMAMFSLRFIKLVGPTALTLSMWGFLTPAWADKNTVLSSFWMSLVVSLLFSFVFSLTVWAEAVVRAYRVTQGVNGNHEADYYKSQFMWTKEMKYHKDQFLYKKLPETKNPEYLTEGTDTCIDSSDARASYGVAAHDVAARAGAIIGPKRMALRGGKVIEEDGDEEPAAGAGAGDDEAPAATVYGVGGGYSVGGGYGVEPEGPRAAATGYAPPGYVPGASLGAAAPGHVPGASLGAASGGVKWEFQVKSGWEAFNMDCQGYIEKKYQELQSGRGKDEINVRTSGGGKDITVVINFGKMTQRLSRHDESKSRHIRRVGS